VLASTLSCRSKGVDPALQLRLTYGTTAAGENELNSIGKLRYCTVVWFLG
jgi:hypothetical protein